MQSSITDIQVSIPVIEIPTIQITDQQSLTEATVLLSRLNKHLDAITADKETLTKPLNQSLKLIRDKYRPTETRLSDAITALRTGMSKYATEQAKIKTIEQAKILTRLDKGTLRPDTAINKLEVINQQTSNTKTDEGTVSFRTVHLWRVKDIKDIPLSLMQPNDKAINDYQKANPDTPPAGIEYYTEEQPINRRK